MKVPTLGRRTLLSVTGASVAMLLMSTAVVQIKSEAAWQTLVTQREQLRLQCRELPTAREPLWGVATDEVAFAHYEVAGAIMGPLNKELREMRRQLPGISEAGFAVLAAKSRGKWLSALAALRAGAHARQVREDAERADDSRFASLLAYREVVNAALYEARLLQFEGDDMGSVLRMLDALTLGLDCVQDGTLINQMIGSAMIAIVTIDCSDDMIQALSPSALEQFAAGLAAADDRLPERMSMQREVLFSLDYMEANGEEYERAFDATLAYGFSTRWMVCDAMTMVMAGIARVHAMPASNWPDRRRSLEDHSQRLQESGNPAIGAIAPNYLAAEGCMRQSIAALRMLRMAVDMYRGVEAEPLLDPTGDGAIEMLVVEGGTMLRTAEADGNPNMQRLVCK